MAYPNPAKKEINIQLAISSKQLPDGEKYIVRIRNAHGQNVFVGKIEENLKINTSDFKSGIHFIEVCTSSEKNCHREKVILE